MRVRFLRAVVRQVLSPFPLGGSHREDKPCRRRATCQPCVERLETRLTPAGSFGFALAITGPGSPVIQSGPVATDRAGDVYVAGAFFGTAHFGSGPGAVDLTSIGHQDVFVAKYTRAGDLVWARQFGGTNSFDTPGGIAVDDAGDVYTTGQFLGTADFDPGPGTFNLTGKGAFVSKLDAEGNFVWARAFTSSGATSDLSEGEALTVDFAGNVYVTGFFIGTADFDPGPGTFNLTVPSGFNSIFVSKLDTGGNLLWAKQFVGDSGNFTEAFGPGQDIAVDSTGDVYTTGTFFATADFDPGPGTFNLNSGGHEEAFVSKLDAVGNFVWAKGFAAQSDSGSTGAAVAVDQAGDVYTAGSFTGTVDFDPGPGTFNLTSTINSLGAAEQNAFIAKLDSNGNFLWAKRSAGSVGGALAVDGAGNVYATGGSGVTKLDSAGNFLWADQFEGIGGGQISGGAIAVDGLGDIYTTGGLRGTVDFDPGPGTFTLSGPAMPVAGSGAAYVSQLRDTPAGTPLPPVPTAQNVYVNPAWAGLAPGTDPDGSGPATAIGVDAFAAIQPALNAAASGGTVHLAPGTYTGALVLYKRVHLVGAGPANTVLTGQGTGLDITAPGVEVSGLTVSGFGTALFASGPAYLALSDVRLTGNAAGAAISGVQVALIAGGPGDDAFFVTPSVVARQGDNAIAYSGVRFLTVDGGGGSNRLTVFLNDISTPDTVWLTAGGIARDTAPFLLFYRDTGGTLGGGVAVVLGEGPEAVVVQGQLAGVPTTVYAEGGDDGFWVLVSETSGYAGLTIDGGPGTNGVAVLDQSGGAVLHDLGPVIGMGVLQVSYPDGAVSNIAYQNINEFLGGLPVTP
jgi:hypothetical protein